MATMRGRTPKRSVDIVVIGNRRKRLEKMGLEAKVLNKDSQPLPFERIPSDSDRARYFELTLLADAVFD